MKRHEYKPIYERTPWYDCINLFPPTWVEGQMCPGCGRALSNSPLSIAFTEPGQIACVNCIMHYNAWQYKVEQAALYLSKFTTRNWSPMGVGLL